MYVEGCNEHESFQLSSTRHDVADKMAVGLKGVGGDGWRSVILGWKHNKKVKWC